MKPSEFHKHLEKIFTDIWGTRCEEHEAGCVLCAVWSIHDAAKQLTGSQFLEEVERGIEQNEIR